MFMETRCSIVYEGDVHSKTMFNNQKKWICGFEMNNIYCRLKAEN